MNLSIQLSTFQLSTAAYHYLPISLFIYMCENSSAYLILSIEVPTHDLMDLAICHGV